MRSGVNGLVHEITAELKLDPLSKSAFLFCGRRCDRIKVLIWEGDGFLLLRDNEHFSNFGYVHSKNIALVAKLNRQLLKEFIFC